MLKKNITYVDYNGEERNEDFYFNLTKAEIMEMELGVDGGMSETINKIIKAKDVPSLIKIFKDLLLRSYGVKSADGKRFIKNEELTAEFSQTEAYSQLFMELATDDKAASEFINHIIPADLAEATAKEIAEKN